MKLERLGEALDFYQHSPGSIGYCVTTMRSLLEDLGDDEALERADDVEEKNSVARKKKYDWDQQKLADPMRRDGSKYWDAKVDATLGRLASAPESFAEMERDTPIKAMAIEFGEGLFPTGVRPITTQRYEDQHASVTELLERLDTEFAEHVDMLNLAPLVEELREFNHHYGESLRGDDEGVTHSEVESARVESQEAFSKLIITVMYRYMDDLEMLNMVLRPFFRQEERLKRHYRRRGSVPELDPETGEPVEQDEPVDEDVVEEDIVVDESDDEGDDQDDTLEPAE